MRLPLLAVLLAAAPLLADGPSDNLPDNVRPIPPKAPPLADDAKKELAAGLKELQAAIADTLKAVKGKKELEELLPDVQIYEKAVRYGVEFDEIYVITDAKDPKKITRNDVTVYKAAIKNGIERAKQLAAGKPTWTTQTGPVLRGYKSKIDGSAQPYWLIVPADYKFDGKDKHRLDFWWHGRFENVMEANFMDKSPGSGGGIIPAAGAFILHPYGRFSNANKFAGEEDTFECLDHARTHYRIDNNKLVARGFSMGGAACWQYATHFPTLWAAAAPGAGFAETKEFLNFFQNETVKPQWWEEKLWRMYDATEYAGNLFNLPTVAYSGENDKQKQAADIMVKYAKAAGVEFPHIIGKGAGHSYTPEAKKEVNQKIDAIVAKEKDKFPAKFSFTTYTLRYNEGPGVVVELLQKHWEKASVEGERTADKVTLKTKNVSSLRVLFPDKDQDAMKAVVINGKEFKAPVKVCSELGFSSRGDAWEIGVPVPEFPGLKEHGQQGPIDDAFMSGFLMVRPTGKPLNDKIGAWTDGEMKHAVKHWRQQFRGDAPIKDDKDVSDDDIKNNNLILWGDAQSNAILGKIAEKLPVQWVSKMVDGKVVTHLVLGGTEYTAEHHMPALIFPNPLNPTKYVVLNSGFTYREYDYLNNARQVSKLPDYAVIDVTTPPNSRFPGKIVRAGFFDEQWKLQKDDGK
jgi:dienelactone hydrolase